MSDNDDIPVLNVLREKMVPAIGERTRRRQRLSMPPIVVAVVAVAVVAAVLFAAQPGDQTRHVTVGGPSSGQPTLPGPTTLGLGGHPVPSMGSTFTAVQTPTAMAATATATIVLSAADRNRTIAVTRGTVIDIHLDGDSTGIWPFAPTSSNGGVLQLFNASNSPTSSHAEYLASASGISVLRAGGGMPCSHGCVQLLLLWAVTVTVS
ncbi:MAG: hypothetical protein QOE04_182 [Mycobacterium sp.]|nr:hypothetical protein [Mycobacterium sp.]